ncbi:MAG: DUF4003 domain-containing protein [Clostridiales bacterium]|jgi:hypothetical protein|nr:DUF4003 domain-containing protein [Clostridiales bacterium]
MEYSGQNKLELFANNWQIIKKEFTWHDTETKRLAALLYAQEGKTIDCEAIRQCHALIKQNTGIFSTFRGNMALCVATLLSLSPNPQDAFSKTLKVYDLLKSVKLRASDFLVIAAYHIAKQTNASDYGNVVARTRSFYDGMKASHFFLTGEDDYIFAAMLGLSDLDVILGVERIEQLHSRLKGTFWDGNSVQTLAQVLVLGDSGDSVITRVLALRDMLRAQKIRLDKTYTLPVLGVLALLPVDIETIVRDISAAQNALKAKKGFGSLSVSTQELLLFAASIIAGDYAESAKDGILTATLATSISNIIIAQQAAVIMMVSASTAATSASASSS